MKGAANSARSTGRGRRSTSRRAEGDWQRLVLERLGHFSDFEKAVQLADAGGVAHFAQGLGFDLTDAFASDAELPADFLERAWRAVAQAEAQVQHFLLAVGQAGAFASSW